MKEIFDIDIQNDENLHGQAVCDTHVRLIRRRAGKGKSSVATYNFEPHNDDSCDICASEVEFKNKNRIKMIDFSDGNHASNLEKLCRVCGMWKEYSYPVREFKQELKDILNIDISEDSAEIHGHVICDNHMKYLRRNAKLKKEGKECTLAAVKYKFVPHAEPNCEVCEAKFISKSKTTKPVRKTAISSTVGRSDEPIANVQGESDASQIIEVFKCMDTEDRRSFLRQLPQLRNPEEKNVLAEALGKNISSDVLHDGMSIPNITYEKAIQYDAQEWLASRNQVLTRFVMGIGNLPCDIEHRARTTAILNKTIEQVYYLRDNRLVLPLSFLQNLMAHIKTSSREAVDMHAVVTPAGSYNHNRNWLSEQEVEPEQFLAMDVVYVFDNEQKFVGRRGLQHTAQQSVITNVAYVAFDEKLQFDTDKAPSAFLSVPEFEEEEIAKLCKRTEKLHEIQEKKKKFIETVENVCKLQNPEIWDYEDLHQKHLQHSIQTAINQVQLEQDGSHDPVDDLVAENISRNQMHCGNCGAVYPMRTQKCKNEICHGQKLAKFKEKQQEFFQTTTLQISDTDQSDETSASLRYSHIECGDDTQHKMIISEPVLCNPASKQNICVLREIGMKSGIYIYGTGTRRWVIVYCDNLPYYIIRQLKPSCVLCTHPMCMPKQTKDRSFMTRTELENHYSDCHHTENVISYSREFDWVQLGVADGHFEHTALKAFFSLTWQPFLKVLVKELGFTTENQLNYIQYCRDHHLSWEIFLVVFLASMRELVLEYVRTSSTESDGMSQTAGGFFDHHKQHSTSDAYDFLFSVVTIYGQALMNLRGAIRRNNGNLAESAKFHLKDLFWARQHMKYQELELYDTITKLLMHGDIKHFFMNHYSMITASGQASGEGYDYRLEEINRNMKTFIGHTAIPSDEQWILASKMCQPVEEIHEKICNLLGLHHYSSSAGKTRFLKPAVFEDAVNKCRAVIRSTKFLTQESVTVGEDHTFFSMDMATHVHPDVKQLTIKPVIRRNHFIQVNYLGHPAMSDPALNHPVFTTYEESDKFTKISNQSNKVIENKISQQISSITDPLIREVLWTKHKKYHKGKAKFKLIEMLDVIQGFLQPHVDAQQ